MTDGKQRLINNNRGQQTMVQYSKFKGRVGVKLSKNN